MDAQGNIYSGIKDEIPADDKARLDGYLRGREEQQILHAGVAAKAAAVEAALEAKVRELEALRDAEASKP